MTALVTKHLPLVAGAPDGFKKLRSLILELAVRGRLLPTVRQPGSDIPVGWIQTKLGSILSFEYGDNLPASKRSNTGEYPVYGSNGVVGTHNVRFVQQPCIVIGRKGSAGALNLCTSRGCCVTDVAYYCIPPETLSLEYTFKLLHTLGLDNLGKGIKPGLNRNEAYALDVLIPTLDEQHRIVTKVDELMALCDRLEADQADAEAAHAQLVQALLDSLTRATDAADFRASWQRLSEHFHTLFTTEASIDALKQTVLQLAVMGKLVPQCMNDEPTSELMMRLRMARNEWLEKHADKDAECRTMLRKLSLLNEPNAPFPIPSAWQPVRLIDCCQLLVDCHNKTAPYVAAGIPIIRTSNIRERRFRLNDLRFVSEETYEFWSRRCPPQSGDIMFTREAPMGEAAIIPKGAKYCLGQRTMLIRPMHDFISNEYLLIALTEPHLLERASTEAIGSTVKHLRVGDVESLAIPLPPLVEQHRIVSKVDELIALCDKLKGQLAKAREQHAQLATALVEQAVA